MDDKKPKATLEIPRLFCTRCNEYLPDESQELVRQLCQQVANKTAKSVAVAITESISREMKKLYED